MSTSIQVTMKSVRKRAMLPCCCWMCEDNGMPGSVYSTKRGHNMSVKCSSVLLIKFLIYGSHSFLLLNSGLIRKYSRMFPAFLHTFWLMDRTTFTSSFLKNIFFYSSPHSSLLNIFPIED